MSTDNPASSVIELAGSVVDKFLCLPNVSSEHTFDSVDYVHLYATELLSLGLLWHGFYDAVKEADGDRILRYWKFLLVLFNSTNHRNYSKKAVTLPYQYYYVPSEKKKAQLLLHRCINTRSYHSTNIPYDLFTEHLNQRLKNVILGMGANVSF